MYKRQILNVLQIVGGILLLITSILLIVLTLMQESKQQNAMSSFSGQSDSYLSKNKSRTLEAKMVSVTKILLIVFLVITVVMNVIIRWVK